MASSTVKKGQASLISSSSSNGFSLLFSLKVIFKNIFIQGKIFKIIASSHLSFLFQFIFGPQVIPLLLSLIWCLKWKQKLCGIIMVYILTIKMNMLTT